MIPFLLAGLGAFSAYSQSQTNANSAESAANAAAYNAIIDKQRADVALQQAGANESMQRRKSAMILGEAASSMASSGIAMEGSPLDVYEQSATSAELDALNIRYGGQLQAQGFEAQRNLDLYSEQVARANATSLRKGGMLAAGAAALSGFASGQMMSAQTDYYKARPNGTAAYGG